MQISKNKHSDGTILICAIRYALGRMTYIPNDIMGAIKPLLPDCDDSTLWCMERDLRKWTDNEVVFPSRGNVFLDEWNEFLNEVKKELEKRKEETK